MSLTYLKIGEASGIEIKMCKDEPHAYKKHIHEELSIGFIERGATNIQVNGIGYYMEAKQAIVISPFVSHKCQPVDSTNWEFTMIYINKNFYKDLFYDLNEDHFLSIKKLEKEDFKKVKRMMDTIRGDHSMVEKEETITEVLAEILIGFNINIEIVKDTELEEIREYIEKNYLEVLKLDELEERFGFNKFRILRSFKNKYNVTPVAYQLQLRVNHGKHLIHIGANIAEIAINAGFYDQAHFTKEFKKAYGITPKQYMNMNK